MELHAKNLSIFTSFYVSPALLEALDFTNSFKLTLEGISSKRLLEGMGGGGGVEGSMGPLPSTFDTIHPIDLIFGTYNEVSLQFRLIETTLSNWF